MHNWDTRRIAIAKDHLDTAILYLESEVSKWYTKKDLWGQERAKDLEAYVIQLRHIQSKL